MEIKDYRSINADLPEMESNYNTPKRRETRIIFGKEDTEMWEALILIERKKLPMNTFIKQCTQFVLNELKAGRNPLL